MNKKLNISSRFISILGVIVIIVCLSYLMYQFAAPQPTSKTNEHLFVISPTDNDSTITANLKSAGYIKHPWAFELTLFLLNKKGKIMSGGHTISKAKNTLELANQLSGEPEYKWVVISEGLRKEEIGERLQTALGWNEEELDKWNNTYTAMKYEFVEGVYFPDTYLLPVDANGLEIASRFIDNFQTKVGPYFSKFEEQDILWSTGLRLASIVQREAASKEDMSLIAGILWNRLLKGQNLEVDATVQYARGKTNKGWWAPINSEDIQNINSLYNTYKHKGLPPHPISNPGIAAIEAVLNRAKTDCFYYLHDRQRNIHCAPTYEEHQQNIEKYLKGS